MTVCQQAQSSCRKPSMSKARLKGSGGGAGSFLGLPGFVSRDRDPPPALFTHPSPQTSHVSIADVRKTTSTATTTSIGPAGSTLSVAPSSGAITKDFPFTTVTTPETKSTAKSAAAARETTSAASAAASAAGACSSSVITNPTNTRRSGVASSTRPNPTLVPASLHYTPSTSSIGSSAGGLRGTSSHATRSTDRNDTLWAKMQATLEEVEFSATGSTHVFRAEHEKKLADLRTAQIALAQAWARSESEDAVENNRSAFAVNWKLTNSNTNAGASGTIDVIGNEVHNMRGDGLSAAEHVDETSNMRSSTNPASISMIEGAIPTSTAFPRPGSSGSAAKGIQRMSRMEEETEVDFFLAKKRREANDKYFHRVNQGVIDVVSKLADVADAMRRVEAESKDIWSEKESVTAVPIHED